MLPICISSLPQPLDLLRLFTWAQGVRIDLECWTKKLLRRDISPTMQLEHKLCKGFAPLVPVSLPSTREVHFWYAIPNEIQDPCLLNMYQNSLSLHEKDDILQMKGDKIQKAALITRALLRTTLSRYTRCKVSPDALRFRKNAFGKPELEWQDDMSWDAPSLHFNVSHSSSLVACGITVERSIGIDVEEKLRMLRSNILSFACRYFTPQEVGYLSSFSDGEIQQKEFIKLWTLKEAYVKALGRGFSGAPFRDFSILFVQAGKDAKNQCLPASNLPQIIMEPREVSEHLTTNWRFGLLELAKSHFASICVEKNGEGREESLPTLKVWKTVPFVADELVSGTDEVTTIGGEFS